MPPSLPTQSCIMAEVAADAIERTYAYGADGLPHGAQAMSNPTVAGSSPARLTGVSAVHRPVPWPQGIRTGGRGLLPPPPPAPDDDPEFLARLARRHRPPPDSEDVEDGVAPATSGGLPLSQIHRIAQRIARRRGLVTS